MDFKNIIRQIAKQNGVTPAEVKRDIQEAIRIGMASSDPSVQAHWKRMSPSGTEPTINEVLTYLVSETVRR
jgi:hypothetical protein